MSLICFKVGARNIYIESDCIEGILEQTIGSVISTKSGGTYDVDDNVFEVVKRINDLGDPRIEEMAKRQRALT